MSGNEELEELQEEAMVPAELAPEAVQQDLLKVAAQAAADGDAMKMVEALFTSRAVDGVKRALSGRWPGMSETDVEQAVAEAAEVLLVHVRAGKKIIELMPYFIKVSHRKAVDINRKLTRFKKNDVDRYKQPRGDADPDLFGSRSTDPAATADRTTPQVDPAEQRARMRNEALVVARRLLPKIGEGKVIPVMEFVLTCVEKNYLHISEKQIAEALNLSVATVHVLLWRGWSRLERAAKEEGVVTPEFEIQSLRTEAVEESEDSGEEDN